MLLNKKVRVALLSGVALLSVYVMPHWLISYIVYPFIVLQSNVIDPIKRHRTYDKTEYEQLRDDYDQLMQTYIQVQSAHDHFADTQEMRQFNKRYDQEKRSVTQIIERYFGDNEHYILLDKGSGDGITVDMVVVYNDMLVGKIIDVFPWYSKCRLITDKQCKVAGCCAQTKACGVMQGDNAHILNFLHVSHLRDVEHGDIIISSGHGTIFPRGFGLGKIIDIHKEHMTYNITCEPLVDIATMTHCSIITAMSSG